IAQNRMIQGTVTDESGEPIVGAAVIVDGTTTGASTNADGRFAISAPASATLTVSYLGFEAQKVAVNNRTSIDITLKESAHTIDDVEIVSFGTVKKRDLTGSVSAVTAQDLQKVTVSTVTDALEGSVPGIQVFKDSGQPGYDSDIIIRGFGSINGSKGALIVVDGVPYSSALTTINPLDIESVVVSKDAAANALYGSRAANGVVFVTTKKGSSNQKANITFEAKWGWNEIGVKEHKTMQNPGDYYEYLYGAEYIYYTEGEGLPHDQAAIAAYYDMIYDAGNYMAYKLPAGETLIDFATGRLNPNAQLLYHDNYDDYLFRKAFRQEYTLNMSGGNNKIDYYISGSFLEDPSYVIKSGFKRYSGRAAVNAQVTNWLKAGANISYSRRDIDDPGYGAGANTGNAFIWTAWQNPTVPYYARDLEGNIRYNEDGTKMLENGMGTTLSPFGRTGDVFNSMNSAHPYDSFSRDINNSVRDNLYANFYADVVFLKDFKFTANFTVDNIYRMDTYFSNNEYGTAAGAPYNGIVEKFVDNYMSYNTQQMLNYHKKIGGLHTVDAIIGHEFSRSRESDLDAYKLNIFYPGIPELGNAVEAYGDGSTGSTTNSAIEGYFARVNYDYDDRFAVSASYRYDGTSLFKYNKWGHFWSLGASWRISNEKFMKSADWVDDLRVRATYGWSGNQINSAYPYTNLWGIGSLNGVPSISQSTVGNPQLTWENNKQFDAGIDFRLWDRVYGSLDYYNRRTHNLIWNRPTPSSTGLTSHLENIGILGNVGFEFDITVDLVKTRNVYWNINLNGSVARNKLIDYPSELGNPALGGDYITGIYLRGKGKSYYNLYLFDYAGIDPANGDELFWKKVTDENGKVIGREKTNLFAEADQFEMGDALPDMTGGLRTSFRWKNLDFSFTASYQIGGRMWDGQSANMYDPYRPGFTVSDDLVRNTWTPDNPGAKFPKLMYSWNFRGSNVNALYRDASYFNIRNINIGYTLPKKWTQKVSLESVRVFFSADNLCLITAHDGFDPRRDIVSVSGFNFPTARSFSFGVTVKL
ncbi:MAG: TonB-dependent receptor, partial [Alistipes sp.]|nr:TonB-dependent receptor [Alistipes sp.]